MLLLGKLGRMVRVQPNLWLQAEPETGLASVDMHRVQLSIVAVGIQVNMIMLTRMNAVFGTIGEELRKLVEEQFEPKRELVCVDLWMI